MEHPGGLRGIGFRRHGAVAIKFWLLAVFGLFLFTPGQAKTQGFCGDFLCACGDGEDAASCAVDCGDCGDLVCDPYEDADSCPSDCGICGDLICVGDETNANCPIDCPQICGDLVCEAGEEDCAVDCDGAIVACERVEPSPSPTPSNSPGPDPSEEPDPDPDDDGVPNDGPGETDNCPDESNPEQIDRDGDGVGDACDPTPTGGNPLDGAEFGGGGGCSLNVRN